MQQRELVFRIPTFGILLTSRTAILDQKEYDGADGVWLQDEDTFEEGFLALEDETVFWMMDEIEAFVARRFKKGRRPGCVSAHREEQNEVSAHP